MTKKNKVIDLFGGKNVIPNTKGISYSKLIDQFLGPFQNEFPEDFYLEDIFEFAITAWNFGNMSTLMPKDEFERIMAIAEKEANHYKLLRKMIDYKAANFKTYSNFIADFEIIEKNGEDVLTVITQEQEDYLAEMSGFDDDNEYAPADFVENYINRHGIVVKPLKSFADWLFNLYPEDGYPEFMESNIYLVNDEIEDLEVWLKKKFDKFFMFELESWNTNKKEWPQKRTYKMFRQWFQVELSTMVFDMEKQPVSKSHELF
ncbi:MAG: ferritin family protein [Lutibacter sp.]